MTTETNRRAAEIENAIQVARDKARGSSAEFDRFCKTYLTAKGRDILETAVVRYAEDADEASLRSAAASAVSTGY